MFVSLPNRLARRATVLLLVAGVAALSACSSGDGSGSKESPTAETSQTQAAKSADADATKTEDASATEDASPTKEADAAVSADGVCSIEDVMTDMSEVSSSTDPQAAVATLDTMATKLSAVKPPAELEADWATFSSTLSSYRDVLKTAVENPSDAENATKITDAIKTLTDEKFSNAATAVETYVTEHC